MKLRTNALALPAAAALTAAYLLADVASTDRWSFRLGTLAGVAATWVGIIITLWLQAASGNLRWVDKEKPDREDDRDPADWWKRGEPHP